MAYVLARGGCAVIRALTRLIGARPSYLSTLQKESLVIRCCPRLYPLDAYPGYYTWHLQTLAVLFS